jgi:membrane-associated phospholipid phosphatase
MGLGLTISVLLFAGGIWAFGGLLEDVLEAESLVRWDIAANDWFHAHQPGWAIRLFHAITQFGSPVVWAVFVLVAVWLVSRHDNLLLWAWVAAIPGGLLLQFVLKASVHRTRPAHASMYLHGVTSSFPSGHSMNATIAYLTLAYLLCSIFEWRGLRRVLTYGAALLVALAVGISRLVLGVHFPSDVVAGIAAGAAWLSACLAVLRVVRWRAAARPPATG